MRRSLQLAVLAAVLLPVTPAAGAAAAPRATPSRAPAATAPAPDNPVVVENRNRGSRRWQLPWPGHQLADDNHLQVKAFTGRPSATPGGHVPLAVTVTPAQRFWVDVFRLGWYHGAGARHLARLGPFHGVEQPRCLGDPDTRELACPWSTSLRLPVDREWISGVYLAVVTTQSRFQTLVPFWVTEARTSDLLYLSSLNTYQAYNDFPYDPRPRDPEGLPRTGRSLYDFSSADEVPAVKVSFDRPFSSQYGSSGDGGLFDFEPELIAFLERSGYDVTYTDDIDVDVDPGSFLRHRAIVVGGHAEYWTRGEYDAAEAARGAGVGLAFVSANEIYWQVRYEARGSDDRRTLVGYKDFAPDPVADPSLRTIRWRDLGRPEQRLIGLQFPIDGNQDWGGQPFVPTNVGSSWVYAGTHLQEGVPVVGEIVGYEIDAYDPAVGPPDGTEYTLLAASPFVNFEGTRYVHNSSIYRGSGGNWVWATGSMDWAWTLAPGGSSDGSQDNVRRSLQIVTRTVLDRMLVDAPAPG